jgi:hypothetical protein
VPRVADHGSVIGVFFDSADKARGPILRLTTAAEAAGRHQAILSLANVDLPRRRRHFQSLPSFKFRH